MVMTISLSHFPPSSSRSWNLAGISKSSVCEIELRDLERVSPTTWRECLAHRLVDPPGAKHVVGMPKIGDLQLHSLRNFILIESCFTTVRQLLTHKTHIFARGTSCITVSFFLPAQADLPQYASQFGPRSVDLRQAFFMSASCDCLSD